MHTKHTDEQRLKANRLQKCGICGVLYNTVLFNTQHLRKNHGISKKNSKLWECIRCENTLFEDFDAAKEHALVHKSGELNKNHENHINHKCHNFTALEAIGVSGWLSWSDLTSHVKSIPLTSYSSPVINENTTFNRGREVYDRHFGHERKYVSATNLDGWGKLYSCNIEANNHRTDVPILNGSTTMSVVGRHISHRSTWRKKRNNENADEHLFRDVVWDMEAPHYYIRYVTFDYKPPSLLQKQQNPNEIDELLYLEYIVHNFCKMENIATGNTITGQYNLRLLKKIVKNESDRYELGYWLYCRVLT